MGAAGRSSNARLRGQIPVDGILSPTAHTEERSPLALRTLDRSPLVKSRMGTPRRR